MLYISNAEYLRVVSRLRNRMLSEKYYKNNCVTRVYVTQKSTGYEVIGQVIVGDMIYTPRLLINPFNKITSTSCQCEFSDQYTTCAHAGALILKLQELSPETFPYEWKSTESLVEEEDEEDEEDYVTPWERYQYENLAVEGLELTQSIVNQVQSIFEDSNEPAHIEIYYEEDYYNYYFRFKIGRKKLYLIKNLYQFLEYIKNEQYYKYGKDFSFKHTLDHFDEVSKKIVKMIQENSANIEKDRLILSKSVIDKSVNIIREYGHQNFHHYYFHEDEKFDIEIEVEKRKEYTFIKFPDKNLMGYLGYIYYVPVDYQVNGKYEGHVYRMKGDNQRVLEKFINHGMSNRRMICVKNEDFNEFYTYVLSPIKNYIQLEGNMDDYQEEDLIEIYGDLNEEEEAVFEIYGIYGDKKENILYKSELPRSIHASMIIDYMNQKATNNDGKALYFDTKVVESIEFITSGIPKITSFANVYVSDTLQNIGKRTSMRINVGITLKNDLLNIDIDAIGIPKEELSEVLKSYKSKKKFHKLKNGDFVSLQSDELDELVGVMDHFHLLPKDIHDGQLDIASSKAYAIDQMAGQFSKVEVKRDEAFKNQIETIKNYKQINHPINKHFESILRDYQKQGFQWLSTMSDLQLGGVLADDMGLGKTIQIISLLESRQEHFTIVVCPSSLVLNWKDEIRKFSSTLKEVCIIGNASEREELIKHAKDYDILITSYDYIRRDYDLYKKIKFDYVILDEAQYIKNQKTKNAQSVKKLKAKHKFALTGTPIENSLAELWSIFDFLNKDYLYNYTHFRKEFEAPIVKEQDKAKEEELKHLISPFVLRRTKKQVLTELPDKVEKDIVIDFEEEEKKVYFAHLAQANKLLKTLDGKKDRIQILAMLTKLRQICCEPRMLFEAFTKPSAKMKACLDIIENYHENNKKIIVFSSFASVLELLKSELKEKGIKYLLLTGQTPKLKRKQMVDLFQENNDITVFLISLKAGGTGLNLTRSEGVIHYDPWWNMSAQNQATDRAHRIGQKNTVFVYKLIMKDSIEEKIQDLQNRKKELADTFVEDNEGQITSMSTSEILSLFK